SIRTPRRRTWWMDTLIIRVTSTNCLCHDPVLFPRPVPDHRRRFGGGIVGAHGGHRASRRALGLQPILDGRAPRHAGHRQRRDRGIMLPNHSPLVIAEQFGTLKALYPGRIDLGLGRAPGSDQATARALRRNLDTDPDAFPRDVLELIAYFEGRTPVRAVPGDGQQVPIWILGSSLFGAQLAAMLGLPYAFASHFAPA